MKDNVIEGLLIEDDPDDTMLLIDLMTQSDWPSFRFTFTCAENLDQGLRHLEKNSADIVLLDLLLPDSRGLDTVAKVRAQAPEVPIVVLTGLADEALGLKTLAHGAQDYVVKGNITGHALKRTISYAVERHRLLQSFRNVIESDPDGIVIVNAAGLVRYINSAAKALFFRNEGQIIGKPFPYPLPEDRLGELKIPAQDGGERSAEVRISEIEWEEQPARLASIRDITDLRRIEQLKAEVLESRRMDKIKDNLMSAVSHGMRSPLTIIKAAAGNLKQGLTGPLPAKQAEMVSLQYKNILRLEKIVDNILDLSRLESDRAEIKALAIDTAHLIKEMASSFQLVAAEHDIRIDTELPEHIPPAHADPELFVQVLSNLIDNALRFARKRVVIRAKTSDIAEGGAASGSQRAAVLTARACVQVSVIDDGAGIPGNRIKDLFNKFVQVDRSTKSAGYKGTGLGLAICKEIVERQKGRIWVESRENVGTQFHFTLPQHAGERGHGRHS
ncbi:MAG TPA: ATP-binding protein [Elusimicrobiota bacterium]|nr:ATP-binding protein [Elusimicrobiota bacterium]